MYLTYEDIVCQKKLSGEGNACWKREIVGDERLPEDIIGCEAALWYRLSKKTKTFCVDVPTKLYSQSGDDRLTFLDKMIKNAPKMIKGYEILIKEHGDIWLKCCPDVYCYYLRSLALRYLFVGDKKEARKWLRIALRTAPFSILNLGEYLLSFTNPTFVKNIYKLMKNFKKW